MNRVRKLAFNLGDFKQSEQNIRDVHRKKIGNARYCYLDSFRQSLGNLMALLLRHSCNIIAVFSDLLILGFYWFWGDYTGYEALRSGGLRINFLRLGIFKVPKPLSRTRVFAFRHDVPLSCRTGTIRYPLQRKSHQAQRYGRTRRRSGKHFKKLRSWLAISIAFGVAPRHEETTKKHLGAQLLLTFRHIVFCAPVHPKQHEGCAVFVHKPSLYW